MAVGRSHGGLSCVAQDDLALRTSASRGRQAHTDAARRTLRAQLAQPTLGSDGHPGGMTSDRPRLGVNGTILQSSPERTVVPFIP